MQNYIYYPFLRGKQYELITLRENSQLLSSGQILPIIEPVKKNLNPIFKSIDNLVENQAFFTVITNPIHFEDDRKILIEELIPYLNEKESRFSYGFIITPETDIGEIETFLNTYKSSNTTIIHYGFRQGRELSNLINSSNYNISSHIFIEKYCGKLYRNHFDERNQILIRDGFIQRPNREHPDVEHFSDLHITYRQEGANGFGDFLIVGDDYSSSGGPAYTVAIHLTFIDSDQDNDMFIKHYKSDRFETPADPGGKFLEALNKLVIDVNDPNTKIFHSKAVNEFLDLNNKQHFPGLGYVKKLSIQHHLELLDNFL